MRATGSEFTLTSDSPRNQMASCMSDVAKVAEVSKATVSRVLNKARYVDPETRKRVLEAAHQLNYYQNVHARRLARGRSDLFGLVISEIANPFFPELIRGFEAAALDRGLEVLLCNTEYGPERIQAAVRKMIENKVRAAAVMTSVMDAAHISELASHQIATVLLDQACPERYVSCIRIDYGGEPPRRSIICGSLGIAVSRSLQVRATSSLHRPSARR